MVFCEASERAQLCCSTKSCAAAIFKEVVMARDKHVVLCVFAADEQINQHDPFYHSSF